MGFPLPQKIGNGYNKTLVPKIFFQFSVLPTSYGESYGFPYLSKFSIVVLLNPASIKWNFKKAVINTMTVKLNMNVITMKITLLSFGSLFDKNLLLNPQIMDS